MGVGGFRRHNGAFGRRLHGRDGLCCRRRHVGSLGGQVCGFDIRFSAAGAATTVASAAKVWRDGFDRRHLGACRRFGAARRSLGLRAAAVGIASGEAADGDSGRRGAASAAAGSGASSLSSNAAMLSTDQIEGRVQRGVRVGR